MTYLKHSLTYIQAERALSTDPSLRYYSSARILAVATFLHNWIILMLLAIPLVVLYYLTVYQSSTLTDALSITILLVATFIFLCVVSMFTKAKGAEALAATAG